MPVLERATLSFAETRHRSAPRTYMAKLPPPRLYDNIVEKLLNRFPWNLYFWKRLAFIYTLVMFSTIFVEYWVKYSPFLSQNVKGSVKRGRTRSPSPQVMWVTTETGSSLVASVAAQVCYTCRSASCGLFTVRYGPHEFWRYFLRWAIFSKAAIIKHITRTNLKLMLSDTFVYPS